MSSPEKQRNKEEEFLLFSLPDELLLSCVARVSRFHYPTLSLVSKRFRSLVASPELYKTRSILKLTEICLYLCLNIEKEYRWFTLWRKPNHQTLTNENKDKKSSPYVLSVVPIPRSPPSHSLGLVMFGSSIYSFSGSNLSILDLLSNTWSVAPSLPLKLELLCASLVDQKMYVAGIHKDRNSDLSENLVVVFDTKTRTWDPVPIPCSGMQGDVLFRSAYIDGKFHMRTTCNTFAYNSKEGGWDLVEGNMRNYMLFDSYCVIENVLYNGFRGEFRWYDTEVKEWREVKGLVGLPKFPYDGYVKLADSGGKMVVLLYKCYPLKGFSKKVLWCGEIALERCERGGVLGTVESFDHLLTVDQSHNKSLEVVKILAATL